jgi:hypothetical protein
MKSSAATFLGAVLSLALLGSNAWADNLYYDVTITNLTRGQVFSPPLVVTHPKRLALFELGQPASPELAALAQDGNNSLLTAALKGLRGVHLADAGAPLPPGESVTLKVRAAGAHSVISVAGMLVSTNDAFFALNSAWLPRQQQRPASHTVPAYDAGAEGNDELCAYIPGPPCGDTTAATSGVGAEGFVHVHAGIHGIGELEASAFDWRNPVASITIMRKHKQD